MKYLPVLLACLVATPAWSAGSDIPGYDVQVDLNNHAALQRGVKYFVNYCLSCHSLKYVRYSRVANDLGLTREMTEENLIFTGRRFDETMEIAMLPEDGQEWFGAAPPDLSVIARQKGARYIYQYLMTFYADEKRPWGVNNWRFPHTTMPHVLWKEQGMQRANWIEVEEEGTKRRVIDNLTLETPGEMTPEQYRQMVVDITSFLVYAAEPARLVRETIGVWVLLFLLVLAGLAFFLKREYWKDVH